MFDVVVSALSFHSLHPIPTFTMNPESSPPPVASSSAASDQAPNSVPVSEPLSSVQPHNRALDERFEALPPSQRLPRTETLGGYIFLCNSGTMRENLDRKLFGLPSRYRDSVRAIIPGLPIFLYNFSTLKLHGIYEATSFGGTNIEPTAWRYNKTTGESCFPAQVRIKNRIICNPLGEISFRPLLHHYEGTKFRLELTVEEALYLIDEFLGRKQNIFIH